MKKTIIITVRRSLFLIFLILSSFGIYYLYQSRSHPVVLSPIPETIPAQAPLIQLFKPKKNPDELREMIKKQIGSTWNNYSILVSDFNSSFSMGINESTIFTAASVNKVPILAALYEEAQKGNVDFEKIITLQQEDIQDYGTGSIRYDPPGTTYSVKTLVRLAAQKSDNTAAYLLANYIISPNIVQTYVNNWGMTQTDIINNKTSNRDMELLFKKIMNGNIANAALTQELLGFLKDSDFEDRLPALLPHNTTVYHKIGTGDGSIHDVGVILSGKKKYYIGIFTSDITVENETIALEAKLSKTVFDYLIVH